MKRFISEEFIRKDKNFQSNQLDFYGSASPLDERGKREFLEKYYLYHQGRYGEDLAFQKAVSQEQAERVSQELLFASDRINFTAYTRKEQCKYQGWYLYTDRAKISRGAVRLSDAGTFPLPCAKYEYAYTLRRIKFSVRIGKGYYREVPEGLMATTTGRFIEFRKGCAEVIKLYFSPDGWFCYKDGSRAPYHYNLKKISPYTFGEWNEIEIFFGEENFRVRFSGEEHVFSYTKNVSPDNVFFFGGMQPVDTWEICPMEIEDANGVLHKPFLKNKKEPVEEERIGEVSLPFALGTEKNKDKTLILKGEFIAHTDQKTICSISTLDPGGDILINGKKVFHTDTFLSAEIDLTPFVTEGLNYLEIVVNPRAPEVLYPWHRHDDYYNAWFCGEVKIFACKTWVKQPIRVLTRKAVDGRAEFDVRLLLAETDVIGAEYAVYIQKIFPSVGERSLLEKGTVANVELCCSFKKEVSLWSTETPTLYCISVELLRQGMPIWKGQTETGFRTITQENGSIYLNGEKLLLKGALDMQFLPPYEEIPINHVCPQTWQIVQQAMAIKAMNGNCLRLHQLGYGTNDERFARVCDRLGVLLIWTTRLIDAVENLMWTNKWKQADAYRQQMRQVINHPSIIMWEGSNELHTDCKHVDRVYDEFVRTVKAEDETRLLCPVSHLYYGGGIYECGCDYYDTYGKKNSKGERKKSSFGWVDKDVVRSAHTYCLLLGYGCSWRNMATQNWRWQDELFEERQKAYIISEFAIIGRQNNETEESKEFINTDSYEYADEKNALGFSFTNSEWRLSQAFQALCTGEAMKQLLKRDADGMLWCSLWGGANNASYLKPVLDFYGYKKLAYYALTEKFQDVVAFNAEADVLYHEGYCLTPVVCGLAVGKRYGVQVEVLDEQGDMAESKRFSFVADKRIMTLEQIPLSIADGYYTVRYVVEEQV